MEIILFALSGCFLGIFTGLIPGIHVNTIALVALSFGFLGNTKLSVLIISMSIVHSFIDFIPSVFLGLPEEDNFLSVLPGHRLTLKGLGLKAIELTVLGGIISGTISILIGLFFIEWLKLTYEIIAKFIPFILMFSIVLMIFSNKEKNKILWSGLIVLLSSIIGIFSLKIISFPNPLFALVTGFFGASTIINSFNRQGKFPKQLKKWPAVAKKNLSGGNLIGLLAGSTVAILPGIGASGAGFLAAQFSEKIKSEKFLIMLGSINTVNIIFSFMGFFALEKTRTGAALALKHLGFGFENFWLLFFTSILAIGFSSIITLKIAQLFSEWIGKINYFKINLIVLGMLILLVFWFSGIKGLFVFSASTGTGLLPIISDTRKGNCMAFLMMPTILIFLGI